MFDDIQLPTGVDIPGLREVIVMQAIRVICASVIFVFAVSCGKAEGDPPDEPFLQLDRDSLGFGQEFGSGVFIGTSKQESLLIENKGLQPLVITNIDKSGDAAFVMEVPAELTVAPLGRTFVRFFFTPTEAKEYTGAIIIRSNASNTPDKTVQLSGRGVAP